MANPDKAQELAKELQAQKVMTIEQVRSSLGGVSPATAFRYLAKIPYRRSYNHNGRYYTYHDVSKYDRMGLWGYQGALFSRDGSLSATVRRLVWESDRGHTQRELQETLAVRVQNVLAALLGRSEISREAIENLFVYLHCDTKVRQVQIERRRAAAIKPQTEVDLEVVVEILLVLLRHPGKDEAGVSRHLRHRSPPISIEQIKWVFRRYNLLGEKGGL